MSMTAAEKVALVRNMFYQGTTYGVISWGPTQAGYRWVCGSHEIADALAETLLFDIEHLGLVKAGFPFRFDSINNAILIIEPLDDVS